MKYRVVDLETSISNRGDEAIGKFTANPHHPDNKIVWAGTKHQNGKTITHGKFTCPTVLKKDFDLLVGHNIGFDILYLIKDYNMWLAWLRTGHIWDTMIAEYMLSGQEKSNPSLDYCAEKYGGTLKDSKIKEYWNDGVETADIPDNEILPYLEGDVENTELVFLNQVERALKSNMLQLIWDVMDFRLATIIAEYDGIHFNKKDAYHQRAEIQAELNGTELVLELHFDDIFGKEFWLDNKFSYSQKYLHPIIFGGKVQYVSREQDGIIKTGPNKGKPKFKRATKFMEFDELITPSMIPSLVMGKNGMYSLDEDALKSILKYLNSLPMYSLVNHNENTPRIKASIECILKIRELKKQSEMYTTFINATWPHDNKIHTKFNHALTSTGRLSSSDPNLQQV